ncbi:D-hexose-6-phosphate mutarotase [Gordonia sp. L191]|uniref:D-hexose-6-phosphate mutarotase n=1 Tax=Gordonia sp. L191 TaxID=2982699 RepID=UPI0024BF2A51|nr:D-hexose-6-phosphate mutarotase [Gordonia sp. L191]WHU49672.1 D-hexose-6-phosphate mutarotase [Gordonia sp. L191]
MTTSGDDATQQFHGVRRGTVHGLDAHIIETPHAQAAISVFGGQVVSFRPAGSVDDVLWVSPALADLPTPIRGGIPVCWPYFAREGQTGDVPSHGYARTARWAITGSVVTGTGEVEISLAPEGLDHLDLRLSMTVRVGATLEQGIHTHNPGTAPVRLTEALHNYFRVSDVADVRVEGLAGLTYADKFDGGAIHPQHGEWALPGSPARSDRLYPGAGGTYRIVDPGFGRVIEIRGREARTAVVWNPGADVAAGMADVGPHWRGFVCVETANAGPDVVEVPAGATHSMWQTISVTPVS